MKKLLENTEKINNIKKTVGKYRKNCWKIQEKLLENTGKFK